MQCLMSNCTSANVALRALFAVSEADIVVVMILEMMMLEKIAGIKGR